jgi:hypothetical protein
VINDYLNFIFESAHIVNVQDAVDGRSSMSFSVSKKLVLCWIIFHMIDGHLTFIFESAYEIGPF